MASRVYFFDIIKKELVYTNTNDIPIIENEEAVVEAVANIIHTRPGEKLMDPLFGADIEKYLFAPIDFYYASQLSEEIQRAIEASEPRALDVNVVVHLDFDNNLYEVDIEFRPASSQEQVTLQVNLEKVR